MKITIIGAGIGGLTTAIALEQKGFEVEIFEAAPEMKRVGAGIGLANNAMKVYQRLGLQKEIEKAGNKIASLNVVDENLVTLSQIYLEAFEKKMGVHYLSIHRGDLQEVLLENLKTKNIHLNKRLEKIEEHEDYVQLTFEDDSTYRAVLLLGADGIQSKVRKNIFPNVNIRIAKQACWRGVCKYELPQEYAHALNESWGYGTRFGIVPLANNEVYWFAVAPYEKDFRKEFEGIELKDLFKGFNPLVYDLLEATPKNQTILNEINDLELMDRWFTNRVCLIGDAAHATTPNMGQGACQAIEDALALSIALETEKESKAAFQKFQNSRQRKANSIIKQSWSVGKLAHLPKGYKRKMRNAGMRIVPSWVGARQTAGVFKLNY